jgi:DNA-binding NtrC family response regulator
MLQFPPINVNIDSNFDKKKCAKYSICISPRIIVYYFNTSLDMTEREIPPMSNRVDEKILIADDDVDFRELCAEIALELEVEPVCVGNGVEAVEQIKQYAFSLALVDLKMPKMGGLDFLFHCRTISPGLPVVIITGYGTIESAVEAMKLGAVDYIAKPCSVSDIRRGKEEKDDEGGFENFGIIGRAKAMQPVYERIEAMQNTDNTVLVMGESGVGKELVAKAIHYHGQRRKEPFIPIDCSVLSLHIVESELFGHIKGAFTDAQFAKTGLLKLAGKGTVFLDEITEIPLQVQAKLLRAIQEREVRPLGASTMEKIEARIIAATNRKLEKAVEEGKFREDLFYRLHVIPISVPPLRERKEDIPILVSHFIRKYTTERRVVKGATADTLKILDSYRWPGNVRELENVIQQTIALGSSEWIRPVDLPHNLRHPSDILPHSIQQVKPLKDIEREAILEALRKTSGRKQDAARLLGIGKSTLYEKLKKYQIE